MTGDGKKGAGVDDEGLVAGSIVVEGSGVVDDDEGFVELGESIGRVVPDPEASLGDLPKGAVIPKVSPAPSQSELVRSGVWIWMNSLSYQSAPCFLPNLVLSHLLSSIPGIEDLYPDRREQEKY